MDTILLVVREITPITKPIILRIKSGMRTINCLFVCLMVFNVTFNNMSVISWRAVLLVEETGVPGENHRAVVSH